MTSNPYRPTSLSPAYVFCSVDNSICQPGIGNFSIAYVSENGKIYYRNINNNHIDCNVKTFGNPDPNIPKTCWSTKIPNNITFNTDLKPQGFNFCSDEGGKCFLPDVAEADILYGGNGKYVYANANNVMCNDDVFGNPQATNLINKNIAEKNETNKCYYRKNYTKIQEPFICSKINDNYTTNYDIDDGIKILIILALIISGFILWYYSKKHKNT